MSDNVLLKMRNIHKRFPGVYALQGVDFTLRKGEIHALMGENGAGKSTLIKVLTGVYTKDEGEISIDGQVVAIHSPQQAQNAGISTVYQEITLCPNLSVAENMYIGRTAGHPRRDRHLPVARQGQAGTHHHGESLHRRQRQFLRLQGHPLGGGRGHYHRHRQKHL